MNKIFLTYGILGATFLVCFQNCAPGAKFGAADSSSVQMMGDSATPLTQATPQPIYQPVEQPVPPVAEPIAIAPDQPVIPVTQDSNDGQCGSANGSVQSTYAFGNQCARGMWLSTGYYLGRPTMFPTFQWGCDAVGPGGKVAICEATNSAYIPNSDYDQLSAN